jgi:hypothetical protein
MNDMLRRVLMSADRVLVDEADDEEVDVNISPELGHMMTRMYNTQKETRYANFSIVFKDGAVLKLNGLFACTLFESFQTKVSSELVKEDHKIFYDMDDVALSEFNALIGLVCGQTKRIK